jgi:hypothetical protein
MNIDLPIVFPYRILVCPTFVIFYVINPANPIRGLVLFGGLCITGLNVHWFLQKFKKHHLKNALPEFPKPFEMTKWVCVSSCFLMVPGIWAFYNEQYLHLFISIYATLFSINHWRKAEDGIRRKMDIIAASSGTLIYFVNWNIYCEGVHFLIGIFILSIVFVSFFVSDYLSLCWNRYWLYIHMFFHFCVSLSEMLVIDCKSRV